MTDQSIDIAQASPAEVPACAALLHDVTSFEPLEFLLARIGGQIAGAAAIVWRAHADPDGFALWLRVMPGLERRGVGRALVGAALRLTAGETDGVRSILPIDAAGPTAAFAQATGFTVAHEEHVYAIEIASLHDSMQRIVRNLSRPGKLPEGTRVIPLSDASLDAVAALVAESLPGAPGGSVATLRERLPNGEERYRPHHSSVTMEGERVVGALLARQTGDRWFVEANVAAPDRRAGWVNALQLARTVQTAVDGGLVEVEFQTDTRNANTMRVPDYGRSRIVRRLLTFYQAASASV